MKKGGYVYILTNQSHTVLYIGITSDLSTRMQQHKDKVFVDSFTSKYNCDKLLFYELHLSIEDAIAREKKIKNWKREWKEDLINKLNPEWKDLSSDIRSYKGD